MPLLIFILMIATGSAYAGEPGISRPVLGYVFDPEAGALRALLGIPGAATWGPVLEVDARILSATISPNQDCALVDAEGASELLLIRPDRSAPAPTGVAAKPDAAIFSPNGRSAAVFHRASGRITVLFGFPGEASTKVVLDAGRFAGSLVSLAVSDDGSIVLAGAGDAVIVLAEDAVPREVLWPGGPVSLAFRGSSHDAVVADSVRDRVVIVEDVQSRAAVRTVATAVQDIAGPASLSVSGDGRRAFTINSRTNTVVEIEIETGKARLVSSPFQLVRIERLAGNAVFLVTSRSAAVWMLLDAENESSRLMAIPAPQRPEQEDLP